jgi:hypothetical protein
VLFSVLTFIGSRARNKVVIYSYSGELTLASEEPSALRSAGELFPITQSNIKTSTLSICFPTPISLHKLIGYEPGLAPGGVR